MIKQTDFITIIVCTYNRAEILKECLWALFNQTIGQRFYEVLVVDNNSTDHTKQVVLEFQKTKKNLRYYLEKKQGLSHARNAGYKNTNALWVGYMDDDGKPHQDYIEKAFEVINNYNFDCFGGRYFAWYKKAKPKWISPDFGTSPLELKKTGVLKKNFNNGGIIFFKVEKLKFIGGFQTTLGMKGNIIAYGEETLIQNTFRNKKWIVGFSPDIKMDHLVATYKYKLTWHLKAEYAHGRDSVLIWNNNISIKKHFLISKSIKYAFLNFRYIKRILKKNYYWQNFVFDYLSPILYLWGYYVGTKKH